MLRRHTPRTRLRTRARARHTAHTQVVGRSGSTVPLEDGSKLSLTLAPTPRWPDLMLVHHSASKLLFSSKLFSAHVLPTLVSQDDTAFDTGGWAKYSGDWRFFFECMLAPTASQAAAVFKNLELVAVPKPLQQLLSSTLPSGGLLGKLMSNFADLLGSSSPTAAASPSAVTAAAAAAAANDAPATSGGSVTRYEVCAICPRHGPVVQGSITQLVGDYRNWIAEQIKLAAAANVAVLYASAYGNTAALAQAISRGVTKGGVGVNTLNLEVSTLDEVSAAIRGASGFIIGSPTLGGHMPTQVQVALGAVVREMAAKNLPCGVFGSFGWSGEAVDEMEAKLRDSGFKFAFDAIRVKFKPTAKDLLTCEESGRNLALQVKRRQKSRESSASAAAKVAVASGSQLAMGRVIGSLCVVTAKYEDATSAMLASWVSQASFNPPGGCVRHKRLAACALACPSACRAC